MAVCMVPGCAAPVVLLAAGKLQNYISHCVTHHKWLLAVESHEEHLLPVNAGSATGQTTISFGKRASDGVKALNPKARIAHAVATLIANRPELSFRHLASDAVAEFVAEAAGLSAGAAEELAKV